MPRPKRKATKTNNDSDQDDAAPKKTSESSRPKRSTSKVINYSDQIDTPPRKSTKTSNSREADDTNKASKSSRSKRNTSKVSNCSDQIDTTQNTTNSSNNSEADDTNIWLLTNNKKVRIKQYEGNTRVDLRNYYNKDERSLPGKNGISLTVLQWKNLLKISDEITKTMVLIENGEDDVKKVQLDKMWTIENKRKVCIIKKGRRNPRYLVDVREYFWGSKNKKEYRSVNTGFYFDSCLWNRLLTIADEINEALKEFSN